ncbi:hypothetical protein [Novosphingopyxis sp.]|uniref:hypothetical protein n=1 Tax=Novosphingopyxis sp. TaxID=2709690 RepID=UPI003B5D05B4
MSCGDHTPLNSGRLEAKRLKALAEDELPDSPAEDEFDKITRLATLLLDPPSAAISLIDDRR